MRPFEVFAVQATAKTTRYKHYRIEPFTEFDGRAVFAVFASEWLARKWMDAKGLDGEIVVLKGETE